MKTDTNAVAASPRVVLLHWLGGSGRTWLEVADRLTVLGARPFAIDLPGFGRASDEDHFSVEDMTESVIGTIQALRTREVEVPWLLAGHSMGGKVAGCVARAAASGGKGLENLAGVILVSPSPPDPEPMEESKRNQLLETLGKRSGGGDDLKAAYKFVDDNTGDDPLPSEIRERAAHDVLRSSPAAFSAWLTSGSKEDLSQRIGQLAVPALLLAGTADAALGPDAQRKHTAPHFAHLSLEILEGCGHLAPLERPIDISRRIAAFIAMQGVRLSPLSPAFTSLIHSDLVSSQTRNVLESRLHPRAAELLLDTHQLRLLMAFCGCVIPRCSFDIVTSAESWLASASHDGWRNDDLPPVVEAWTTGLRTLDAISRRRHGAGFASLDSSQQDTILKQLSEKSCVEFSFPGTDVNRLFDGEKMLAWFEDARATLARLYIAHPRTMQQIGFSGFADEHGFTRIRLAELEEFER